MNKFSLCMLSEKSKGYFAVLLSTFFYGWFGVLVKMIGDSIPIFYQSVSRNFLIAFVSLIFLVIYKRGFRITCKEDVFKIIARASFGFINITTALIAFKNLSIGLAYILFFAGLLFGSFAIGAFYSKEKLTRIKVISLLLTVIGVILAYAYRIEISGEIVYVLLAIVSGVCVAFWNIFAQYISDDITATALNFYDAILLMTFSLVASLFVQETWVSPNVSIEWIANIGMAITFIFAGILVPYGFRRVEAQIGSILMPLEIVFGVLFGYIIFRDDIHIALVVGCALIIIASVLPHVWELRGSKRIHKQ
jgi:drug/metabolite transporter (DMT)-like permease